MKSYRLPAILICAVLLLSCFTACDHSPAPQETETKQPTSFTRETTTAPVELPPELPEEITFSTRRGALRFPGSWGDRLNVKMNESQEQSVVSFYAVLNRGEVLLFDAVLDDIAEDAVGVLKQSEHSSYLHLNMGEIELSDISANEQDLLYAMQEDVNYLIEKLD